MELKWIDENYLDEFFSKQNYDIRLDENKKARWIDQKCKADVLSIVADCIINYCKERNDTKLEITSKNIWYSDYANANIQKIFKKPNPDKIEAKNEYDKFFQQPLELFSYAKILSKEKNSNRNIYIIRNIDILFYLSISIRNSLTFLTKYIEKVLKDSGFLYIEDFFNLQNNVSYHNLKETFERFTITNTKINGKTECNRIFTVVINPLAFNRNAKGTRKGRISKDLITYDELMYNRINFRDINSQKPKSITRKEHDYESNESYYFEYLTQKAKEYVKWYNKLFNSERSELEPDCEDKATHIHHIFPKAEFPMLSAFPENLIALTPTEHYNKAHVDANTSKINPKTQIECLLAKLKTIEIAHFNNVDVYSFSQFMKVLDIGLNKQCFQNINDLDFNEVRRVLSYELNNLD